MSTEAKAGCPFSGRDAMGAGLVMTAAKRSRVRLLIVTMLFVCPHHQLRGSCDALDRRSLARQGPRPRRRLHGIRLLGLRLVLRSRPVARRMLLDRYGAKWVYAGAIFLWSTFTLMQGAVASSPASPPWRCCSVCAFSSVCRGPGISGQAAYHRGWFPQLRARHGFGVLSTRRSTSPPCCSRP